ncbi:hypothetical protein WKT22_01598 [Candidatus Lokiarchaeum ossiferum]
MTPPTNSPKIQVNENHLILQKKTRSEIYNLKIDKHQPEKQIWGPTQQYFASLENIYKEILQPKVERD